MRLWCRTAIGLLLFLTAASGQDETDPWIAADELCSRGEYDAAAALAKAIPKLSEYVAARRGTEPDREAHEAVARMNAAFERSDWKAALAACGTGDKVTSVAHIRLVHGRGIALARLKRRAESAKAYARAADGAAAVGWLRRLASIRYDEARLAYDHSDWAGAQAAWRKQLKVVEALDDQAAVAKALSNIGITHRRLRQYPQALEVYRRAIAIRETLDDTAGIASILLKIGMLQGRRGEHKQALAAYGRALPMFQELGDDRHAAIVHNGIGNAQRNLGEYSKALGSYRRCLELAGDDQRVAAMALNNLGVLYRRLGEPKKALKVYRRTLAIKEKASSRRSIAATLGNIGAAHQELEERTEALAAYGRALEIFEAIDDKRNAAAVRHNIGNVLSAQGKFAEAIAYYRGALAFHEALDNKTVMAEILNNLGITHFRAAEYADALACHQRALGLLDEATEPVTRARVLWGLAQAHFGLDEWQPAVARAREAIKMARRFVGSLGEQQGASARGRWSELFAVGARAALREEAPAAVEDLVYFLESGRAGSLLESLSSREALREALIPERLRTEEERARAAEQRAAAALEAAKRARNRKLIKKARQDLDDARTAVDDVVTWIQREAKAGAAIAYPKADGLAEIQARLDKGDALVLCGIAGVEAMALVVRPESARAVPLRESTAVIDACDQLLLKRAPYVDEERVAALRTLVIEPLKLGDDVKRVLVSPAGRLSYVPFALLLPKREVVYVPSGTTHGLLAADRDLRGKDILALGDPNYGTVTEKTITLRRGAAITKLSRLPETRDEVASIGSVRLLGNEATETGLKRALEKHGRWRAVHFACHGLIDPDHPMLSSLALTPNEKSDGFLTCREVFDLRIPADLVVLSACETGKGRIYLSEGIVGFTRAFMYAGAPRVMVSLWKVDDAATKALMVKFYELWEKQPAATALKQAQAFVRSHEGWQHPYYWAAWQLWGLPD